jgi:hypothetical protein
MFMQLFLTVTAGMAAVDAAYLKHRPGNVDASH